MLTAAEERIGLVPTVQYSSYVARTFIQRAQERFKNFDQHLCGSPRIIKTDGFVFIDVTDGVTKIPMKGLSVNEPYRVLEPDHHAKVIQCESLVQWNTAGRIALALRPAGVPPISPEPSLAINIENKTLEGASRLFHKFSDYYLKNDGQFEILLNWVPFTSLHGSLATTCCN